MVISEATIFQKQTKTAVDSIKIEKLNNYIVTKKMIWKAGNTFFSNQFYNERKIIFGNKPNTHGFEFYTSGIFSINESTSLWNQPHYDIIENFDWRSRHNANKTGSPYIDFDTLGSGWMTGIKCQNGCWNTTLNKWECTKKEECIAPNIWRETGSCQSFATLGAIEGLSNLYYNRHFDFDLSEQQLASPPSPTSNFPCAGNLNGSGNIYQLIANDGVVDENCFPFEGISVSCDSICNTPDNIIKVSGFNFVNPLTPENLKKNLIANGPLIWSKIPSIAPNHQVALVGFDIVDEGDFLYYDNLNQAVLVEPDCPFIGMTYWFLRNSYGLQGGLNGYYNIIVYSPPESVRKIELPILSEQYDSTYIICWDADQDGYCNWGIGQTKPLTCPECQTEKDGNDADTSLGPIDEYGFCSIINNYQTSFETHYDNWKQVASDQTDWRKHSGEVFLNYGPSKAYEGNYYFYFNGTLTDPDKIAIIESPLIQFGLDSICYIKLDFAYYCHFGSGLASSLVVQGSSNSGDEWYDVWSSTGSVTNSWDTAWHIASVLLSPNTNKVRFKAVNGSYPPQSNIGIDKVQISKISQNYPWLIEGNRAFYGQINICGDIIIDSASTLTLKPGCKLLMNEGKKIIVRRYGRLNSDSAIITSSGLNLWKGIEVWGNNNETNSHPSQGRLFVYNHSSIENAECAVRTTRISEQTQMGIPEYTGGMVWIYNHSKMLNNLKTAEFLPYTGGVSLSRFTTNSVIELNDNYFGPPVNEMIHLCMIDGVYFSDVTFCDLRTNVPVTQKAIGINAFGSRFNVTGSIYGGNFSCSFNNMFYGIKSMSMQPNDIVTISKVRFSNNLRGIYISASYGSSTTFCEFNPWENSSPLLENYGLYFDNCPGFQAEENNFINYQPARKGNGLIVNNSGGESNLVYRNNFTGFDYGILAQNKNRSSNGLSGLSLKCNNFNVCNNDITILSNASGEDPQLGIATNQGSSSANPTGMAGNLFFIEDDRPNGDFDDINNQLQHINYYYPTNANNNRIRPVDYTQNSVSIQDLSVNPSWTYENGCPSNFGGGSENEEAWIQIINETQQKSDSIQQLLSILIDAGNTADMLIMVNNSAAQHTLQAYTVLMNTSPYLTDSVVVAVIEKEDVFPGFMLRDIMVASPNTAKSDQLFQKLSERNNPLPDYLIAQIINGRSIVSIREETESKLTHWQSAKMRSLLNLYQFYLNDTINREESIQKMTELLSNDRTLWAKYAQVFWSLKKGSAETGIQILNSIPLEFGLSGNESDNHLKLCEFFDLLAGYQLNNTNIIMQPDSIGISQLVNITDTDNAIAGRLSGNILIELNRLEYTEPVLLPEMFKSTSAYENYNKLLSAVIPKNIKVSPNPSKEYIIIDYSGNDENPDIEIVDLKGELIEKCQVESKQNSFLVYTQQYETGIYMAVLIHNGKVIESCKFTIIR